MRFACNVYCEIELATTSGWEAFPHGCIVHGARDTHPRMCRFNILNTFIAIERRDSSNSRGKSAPPHLRCFFGLSSDGTCAFSCSTLELQVISFSHLIIGVNICNCSFAVPSRSAAGGSACACSAADACWCCTASSLPRCHRFLR
jgi:hypothetical protein